MVSDKTQMPYYKNPLQKILHMPLGASYLAKGSNRLVEYEHIPFSHAPNMCLKPILVNCIIERQNKRFSSMMQIKNIHHVASLCATCRKYISHCLNQTKSTGTTAIYLNPQKKTQGVPWYVLLFQLVTTLVKDSLKALHIK